MKLAIVASQALMGYLAAVGVLTCMFLGVLMLFGSAYFEVGMGVSYLITLATITILYVAGVVLVFSSRRIAIVSSPSYVLFGILLPIFAWGIDEFLPIRNTLTQWLSEGGLMFASTVIPLFIASVVGYLRGPKTLHDETHSAS